MASGGEVAGAKVRQSDAMHEYTCSSCSNNDVTTEATHYCTECDVCYCKACLCDHVVIGRSKVEQWGKAASGGSGDMPSKEAETQVTCLRHPGHQVTLHCEDHGGILCCQLCSSAYHRNCLNVKPLPVTVQRSEADDCIANAKFALEELERKTTTLQMGIEMKTTFLENSHAAYIRQLDETEENIIVKFKEMRQNAMVSKQYYIDKFNADMLVYNIITEDIATVKINLNKQYDERTRYVRAKWVRDLVKDKTRAVEDILNATDTGVFRNINDVDQEKVIKSIAAVLDVKMTDEMKQLSLETKKGETERRIVGICQIDNGNIVLADSANGCLIQLDKYYSVTSEYKLQGISTGLCATGDNEVAVAINSNAIFIFNVQTEFEYVRTLNFDHPCMNFAYHNGILFIPYTPSCVSYPCNCNTTIHTYDKSSKVLEQIFAYIGVHSFSTCDNGTPICISADGKRIYVAHRRGLVGLDSQGWKLARNQKAINIENIVGLCLGSKGHVYASKGDSKEVVKLISEASILFLSTDKISINVKPGPLCYDKRLGCLVISPKTGSDICVKKESDTF